jgi:ATP-binding cassette subfamily F protein uup
MSNKDRQTLASLPELIERLEAEQTGLNELLARPETYRDATIDVGQLSQRVREIALELEQAMTHWEELLHKESAAADRA